MPKQTDVGVVCPDCGAWYVQRVTGEYIGPRKRAPNYKPVLQQWCQERGQTDGSNHWYGLMLCGACSLRRCPPTLRMALMRWLEHGEVREGDYPPV